MIKQKELSLDTKMKIVKKISESQSKRMILWEFKITESQLKGILKEFNIHVRNNDEISFANKLSRKNLKNK